MEEFLEGLKTFDPGAPNPSEFIGISHNSGAKNPFYGMKHTDEWKQKRSELYKGKTITEEHKIKIKNTLKGRPFTEERKRNVSAALYKQKFNKYAKLYEFEWNGQIIKEFNTIKQLSKKYKIPKTTLLRKLGRTK